MRLALLLVIALGAMGAVGAEPAPPSLPRGSEHFRLGMSRAQVDSAVAARKVAVISNGTAFLVCESDDPGVEYEQYSFFQAPHGVLFLWKVTLGYRLTASAGDFVAVRDRLRERLGEPVTDSGADPGPPDAGGNRPGPAAALAIWLDPSTVVRLGARWTDAPDRAADRMLLTWTDRRLQRTIDARRKKARDAVAAAEE